MINSQAVKTTEQGVQRNACRPNSVEHKGWLSSLRFGLFDLMLKFDNEQKMKEQQEILKEQRLKQRELNELNLNNDDTNINKELSSQLENFEVDKTSEN